MAGAAVLVDEGALRDLLATASSGYRLRSPEPERARVVCLAQAGVSEVAQRDGELRFHAAEDAVAALSVALGQARIPTTALVPEVASLEELFLGMTEGETSDKADAVVA